MEDATLNVRIILTPEMYENLLRDVEVHGKVARSMVMYRMASESQHSMCIYDFMEKLLTALRGRPNGSVTIMRGGGMPEGNEEGG